MQRQRRLCDLLGIELPIAQAPMAGSQDHELALAVTQAGGLGSLPCALLSAAQIREQVRQFRTQSPRAINLNFFCHAQPAPDLERERQWRARLEPYYRELNVPSSSAGAASRVPFDSELCELVEELRPTVVSFHFGLPARPLLERVRATGAKILSSATTVAEARWLEAEGVDVIIAQGAEAGGHRGMFLDSSLARPRARFDELGARADATAAAQVAHQVGTMALVPQVVDAVQVPVLAAGGIADARGVLAAIALGASGVQIGTAYLKCRESKVSALHRAALHQARDDSTQLTNVFTGRPARSIANRLTREVGPLSPEAPAFPIAAAALAPLRTQAEANGSSDFSPLWAGQAVALSGSASAGELTRGLWAEALEWLERLKA